MRVHENLVQHPSNNISISIVLCFVVVQTITSCPLSVGHVHSQLRIKQETRMQTTISRGSIKSE